MDAQTAVIQEAHRVLQADPRVLACWLEGSFASGTADPWSDVDLHVAVDDDAWDSFFSERLDVLGRIRPILGYGENSLAGGMHLVFANLAGPVRLDFYLEKRNGVPSAPRRDQPQVLFDRAGVAPARSGVEIDREALRAHLQRLVRGYFFGAMWPVRLWGRQAWGSLLMNATVVVWQILLPTILLQERPEEATREPHQLERLLSPQRRVQLNALLEQLAAAFHGIGHAQPDQDALVAVHGHLLGFLWHEFRAACTTYDLPYPEAAEQEIRDYFRRELGLEIPS